LRHETTYELRFVKALIIIVERGEIFSSDDFGLDGGWFENQDDWNRRIMVDSILSNTDPAAHIRELQTRFLYPFFFHLAGKDASDALLKETFTSRDGTARPLWHCEKAHMLYRDELLGHVEAFLFDRECSYLKISDVAANLWFDNCELIVDKRANQRLPVKGLAEPRVELFLSPMGVGILSFALALGSSTITLGQAADFNYHLSQFRRHPSFIHKKHPMEDPARWNALPPSQRALIPPPPDESQPLEDQLRLRGGRFTLEQIVAKLLLPLKKWGFDAQHPLQKELCVFTVARFSSECDFGKDSVRHALASFLSGLTQVEEPQHAGAPAGELTVSNAVLNRKQWTAIGQLGAAHLVADQEAEDDRPLDFNEQRAIIVRDKYFIPYLLALFQRLVSNRLVDEAGKILSKPPDGERALDRLRLRMLEFAVSGQFVQVSVREAVHRFYLLAQNGLDVPRGWNEVRRAISDLTAHYSARRQEEFAASQHEIAQQQASIAEDVSRNIQTVAHVQLMLEWIEIFLVSVYSAHLAEMLFPDDHVSVMVAASLGAVATACAVLPRWKQIFSVIAVSAGLFALLFLHHKGIFKPSPICWTDVDNLILGGWVAFTALCLGLRRLRSDHESH